MSNPADEACGFSEPSLTFGQASRLLRLTLQGDVPAESDPVWRLVGRLQEPEGTAWFASALTKLGHAYEKPMETLLGQPRPTLDDLRLLKSASAALAAEAVDDDDFLAGTLGYFLTLSAGLAYHNEKLSSRSVAQVKQALFDLAEAVPEDWQHLVRRAGSAS